MKDEATPEQIELARRIAQDNADAMLECLFGGGRSDTVRRVVQDGLKAVALAAIIETQRLDAELATSSYPNGTGRARTSKEIADAIRAGKHYGKDTDQ